MRALILINSNNFADNIPSKVKLIDDGMSLHKQIKQGCS